jgi:uncharacterized protein (DUF2141 family)
MCSFDRVRVCAGLIVALASPVRPASAAEAGADRIEVSITGLRSGAGQVLCALHSSADAFPGKSELAVQRTRSPITNKAARCTFEHVAAGTYAVSVFHDENGNMKLDKNFLGIPIEGIGVSRDAKGFMGPPRFDNASFAYPGGVMELTIHMQYM